MSIAAFRADLGDVPVEDHPRIVQQRSRDHYWYSPVLKAKLDQVSAKIVVSPRTQDEVKRVLAAAHKHKIAVTPRGRARAITARRCRSPAAPCSAS